MDPHCMADIMILAQAVLQILFSQSCFSTQNDKVGKYLQKVNQDIYTLDTFLKRYWNDSLKELHDVMKEKRVIWLQNGKARGDSFDLYKQYKLAKCAFRKWYMSCAEKYLDHLNEVIDNATGLDNVYFWKMVNRRSNSRTICR